MSPTRFEDRGVGSSIPAILEEDPQTLFVQVAQGTRQQPVTEGLRGPQWIESRSLQGLQGSGQTPKDGVSYIAPGH